MKEGLGEKAVSKVMGWRTPDQAQGSRRRLRALAASGCGDYIRLRPGMRLVESMALWLSRFKPDERQAAHGFVVKRVIFITRSRMEHAASIACPDLVAPALIRQAADESSGRLLFWRVWEVLGSDEFRMMLAQCLLAGMSGGSHMDLFRSSRGGGDTGHEQALRPHGVSGSRSRNLAGSLEDRMSKCGGRADPPALLFRNVLLIDDSSASGKPYLRGPDAAGNIARFRESINGQREQMQGLADKGDLRVHVPLYAATDRAVDAIRDASRRPLPGMSLTVDAVRTIPSGIKLGEDRGPDFYRLASWDQDKYGRSTPPDRHIREGASEKPYPWFGQCALPLVLRHNTPSNSLPILHANEKNFAGPLPRIRRRK